MVPKIPGPNGPLEDPKEQRNRKIGFWFFIFLIVWWFFSFFYCIGEVIEVFTKGPAPLREGYIPKAQRIHQEVKFLPKGADPRIYVKPPP